MIFELFFCYLWPFLTVFEPCFDPIWGHIGPFWATLGPKSNQNRVILGSVRDHFWHRFGILLWTYWCRFDPILRPFLGPFFGAHFWPIFGLFWTVFGQFDGHFFADLFWVMFWEVGWKVGKMMQEKAKYANFCQNSPKSCKIVQKQAVFLPRIHLFCLKISQIDVSTYESVQ